MPVTNHSCKSINALPIPELPGNGKSNQGKQKHLSLQTNQIKVPKVSRKHLSLQMVFAPIIRDPLTFHSMSSFSQTKMSFNCHSISHIVVNCLKCTSLRKQLTIFQVTLHLKLYQAYSKPNCITRCLSNDSSKYSISFRLIPLLQGL